MSSGVDLFVEKPHCFALSIKHLTSYCHGCLRAGSSLKKCLGCRFFAYCSPVCQKKDWKLHKRECMACKKHDGVSNEEIRLVMRLAVRWEAGEMGEATVDGVVRSLSTLEQHADALEGRASRFLEDFKIFFKDCRVDDDLVKRLCRVVCVNSFSLTNEHSSTIGISLCIRLSAIDHSCVPNMRYAYRQNVAVMVPTRLSNIPTSLEEARHSYINELLPRKMRRELLMSGYNFFCECVGCMDDDRTNRMEGWHCEECADGWLPPQENAKCVRCNWTITRDHYEVCRVAEETANASNEVLLNNQYKLDSRVQLAAKQSFHNPAQVLPVFEGALYRFNVLRFPSLRTLYEHAISEKNTEDMIKYGSQMLAIQEQYQNKNDLALCHLKYGLAQAFKSANNDEKCREVMSGVAEVFARAYGETSQIYTFASLIS
ncbi:unnamed protein product [Nippostrongylus brasiliensis]|uniref:MYND-type domain-containing protein n=1 Tax=Nippostrongylus brasiliensis TaxID=27835 RepID=A0A0N4YS41_NIPBR|nr:unnamed protein product [Nippostrongylus brasiliensis]